LTAWIVVNKPYGFCIVVGWIDAMIHSGSDELIRVIRLKSPDVSIDTRDLIECSTVNNCLPSAG